MSKKHKGNPEDALILDTRSLVFHKPGCPALYGARPLRIDGKPILPEYLACSICCPQIAREESRKEMRKSPSNTATVVAEVSKGDFLRKQLQNICFYYGMEPKFIGGTMYVTTAAGEWFFHYNDRPISLHHRNARVADGYHVQDGEFYSPAGVLAYIYAHDNGAIKRLFEDAPAQISSTDEPRRISLKAVKPQADHSLVLQYEGEDEKRLFSATLWTYKPKYSSILPLDVFMQAKVENGNVFWPQQKISMDARLLYEQSVPISELPIHTK